MRASFASLSFSFAGQQQAGQYITSHHVKDTADQVMGKPM